MLYTTKERVGFLYSISDFVKEVEQKAPKFNIEFMHHLAIYGASLPSTTQNLKEYIYLFSLELNLALKADSNIISHTNTKGVRYVSKVHPNMGLHLLNRWLCAGTNDILPSDQGISTHNVNQEIISGSSYSSVDF